MNKLICVLILALSLPGIAQATDFQMRGLLHGTHEVKSGFGIAGWVVEPNLVDQQWQFFSVIGPRYQQEKWWIEVMGGGVLQDGGFTPVINVRSSGKPTQWLHYYAEVACFPTNQTFYWFLQADYPLPIIAKLGVETENTHNSASNSMGLGPHLVFPFGEHFTAVLAYQFRFAAEESDFFRVYLVLDF